MVKIILIYVLFFITGSKSNSQSYPVRTQKSNWNFEASSSFYFLTEDFLIIPEFKADNNKLHLEARYNYEDTKTISIWAGYNFLFGKNLMVLMTPMAASVLGNTKGIAPGLELTVSYGRFGFYSESEYLFDLEDKSSSFFYNWSEISFSPLRMCSIGLAAQRTLAYNNDNEFQFGISAGFSYLNLSTYAYYFNIGGDDNFIMISAAVEF